MVDTADSACLH